VSIGLSFFLALGIALAAAGADAPPTFNRDVAQIFYGRCVSCHRPGQAAPMSLLTYQDARPWARAIRARVAGREMPPWFADPRFGRNLAHDPRLTDREIATVLGWVDAGAPEGAGSPPVRPLDAEGWHRFKDRPPDAIIEMSADFDIPAEGAVPVFTLWSPNPFTEDKFIEAVELRPGATAAVHHSDVTARTLPPGTKLARGPAWKGGPSVEFVPVYADGRSYNELGGESDPGAHESAAAAGARRTALQNEALRTADDYRLLFYVPGGGYQEFPPGAVKRISAGNVIAWNLHYTPTGRPYKDRHRLGLWFARTPPSHEVVTKRIGEAHIVEGREFVAERESPDLPPIPPFADDWRITAITPFQEDVTLYGLWPHMHVRGKDMTFIATYPDGREEVLLHVPKYDFQWQLQYELAEPLHLPAGSTIKAIGHYDNSPANRNNPKPGAPVYWSEQSWDEMFNGWMDLSFDGRAITRRTAYPLATPMNRRVSLGIGSGPPGTVYVRNADGSLLTSGPIAAVPSFIEPWTFAAGQTIETERTGADTGTVTVTLFDVPPDVAGSLTIDGTAVAAAIEQPGQNGIFTFNGVRSQAVAIHVSENSIGAVTIRMMGPEGATPLVSATFSAIDFDVPRVTLPSTGTYSVMVDPDATNVGSVKIALTSRVGR
jgi:mono/diheme cytochrome c family protein